MAENHETKLYFAIRKETNQLVHISEMEEKDRGSACDCVCVYCGRPLVAKLGHGKRIKHFAHLAENGAVACSADKANESGLHKMAKRLICESNYINLPKVEIPAEKDTNRNWNDYNQQQPLTWEEKRRLEYREVQTEVLFDGFKPDICIMKENEKPFLIEIAVTHYADAEKQERIRAAQLSTVEINIADFRKEYKASANDSKDDFAKKLRTTLIELTENKSWIYHPREKEGIQKLCERNRKLEEEYQQKRMNALNALREKEMRSQKERRKREQVDIEIEELHKDDTYYLWHRDKLKQADDTVLEQINHLGICSLRFKTIEDIPFFFDIPVFGEVAFNCDRRIWQAIIFEKICFEKLFSVWKFECVNVVGIYCYFVEQQESLLNKKFVYIQEYGGDTEFQRGDLLCVAIEEYLLHLSALGFADIRYYYYPDTPYDPYSGIDCTILHNTLTPQRKEYAEFLKETLKAFPDTSDPFGYFQKKWEQKNAPFTRVCRIDTLERLIIK